MQAIADLDGARLRQRTCDALQQEIDFTSFVSFLGIYRGEIVQQMHLNVDELSYQTERNDGTTAIVRMTGTLRYISYGTSQTKQSNITLAMLFERGAWRACPV